MTGYETYVTNMGYIMSKEEWCLNQYINLYHGLQSQLFTVVIMISILILIIFKRDFLIKHIKDKNYWFIVYLILINCIFFIIHFMYTVNKLNGLYG